MLSEGSISNSSLKTEGFFCGPFPNQENSRHLNYLSTLDTENLKYTTNRKKKLSPNLFFRKKHILL